VEKAHFNVLAFELATTLKVLNDQSSSHLLRNIFSGNLILENCLQLFFIQIKLQIN
jgi:hypothetical protein